MKILLLEDEMMLKDSIREYLEGLGHKVVDFGSGKDAADSIMQEPYDLLILDINVPILSGFEILEAVNAQELYLPVIFISALVDIEEIARAYELGCSDYLKKPFHLKELALRIHQVTRKAAPKSSHAVLGRYTTYCLETKVLSFRNEPQELTKKQQQILHLLTSNIGRVVDFETFREEVWENEPVDNPTIRAEVSRLKKVLREDIIKNIRGLGYKICKYFPNP